jgi:hypothetical protein
MNSFLKGGVDDGELGTTIEWDPCELSQADYIVAVSALMKGEPFEIDTRSLIWKDWMAEIEDEKGA